MEIITLTKEELKKIKKDFFNGGVMTDGCFCGEAVSNFRDDLYVMMSFSCRKSGACDNDYYTVHNVYIGYKARERYTDGNIEKLIKIKQEAEFGFSFKEINGYKVFEDDYWNLYLIDEDLKFDDESLRQVQKKLFKYYKESYGSYSDAKFKNVGRYCYKEPLNQKEKREFAISDVAEVVLTNKETNEIVFKGELPIDDIEIVKENK